MNVICLQEPAFNELIDRVVDYIKKTHQPEPEWISGKEVMQRLNITSKTTLQNLRDNDEIEFSQNGKMILYRTKSIGDYLKRHSNKKY